MAVCVNVCDYIIHYRECQWFFWKKFFCFFKKVLCFLEKMWYTKPYHFICACSSVDRAPASGAGCVGSIPIRRTKIAACKFLQAETYIPRFFIESFVLFWHWFFTACWQPMRMGRRISWTGSLETPFCFVRIYVCFLLETALPENVILEGYAPS